MDEEERLAELTTAAERYAAALDAWYAGMEELLAKLPAVHATGDAFAEVANLYLFDFPGGEGADVARKWLAARRVALDVLSHIHDALRRR